LVVVVVVDEVVVPSSVPVATWLEVVVEVEEPEFELEAPAGGATTTLVRGAAGAAGRSMMVVVEGGAGGTPAPETMVVLGALWFCVAMKATAAPARASATRPITTAEEEDERASGSIAIGSP